MVQERLDGKLVVCYQNQIVPTQEAPPRPGVLRTLNATRGLGSVTVENLAAGMDTNGIGGHERAGSVVTSERDRWSRARKTGSDDRDRPGTRRREIDHGSRE